MLRLLLNLAILILCFTRSQSFHSDFRVAKKSRLKYHVVGWISRMPDRGYKQDCSLSNDDNVILLPSPPSSIDHFDRCGLDKEWNGLSFSCQMSAHLTEAEKATIYQLFKTNMEEWYKKNWGLKDSEKKKELYHTESHFICVHKITGLTHSEHLKSCGSSALVQEGEEENELVAFAMFRFEWDDEDEPEFPVLFCYEIQICDAHQGKKIGRHLMDLLVKIAKHEKKKKVMLTCFKNNVPAMAFYYKIGFTIDSNSPSSFGHMNELYEILSIEPE